MKIKEIIGGKDKIHFLLENEGDGRKTYIVKVQRPFGVKETGCFSACGQDEIFIDRYWETEDLLTAEFAVYQSENSEFLAEEKRLEGPKYVTDLKEASLFSEPYPKFRTKKTLSECGEDYEKLGIEQTVLNINLPAIMTLHPQKENIEFQVNGETYFFLKKRVDEIDQFMERAAKRHIAVTAILLNSPRLFDSTGEKELLTVCIHPDFDWSEKNAFISAFSMKTRTGQAHYQAFVEFLASRYAGDEKFGCLKGMIVSNEIDSQYMWGNAGEKTVEEYMEEYTEALRLTYLAGRKYYSELRVYVSLDHLFNISYDQASCLDLQPKRYYRGRQVLELLNQNSQKDGNFNWSVAYHPYPEDLCHPDFYNDRSVSFYFSTPRITYKNIEMLPAYLEQERFLYRGQERHIILSEQGFNSKDDGITEYQGAAAYVLAYQKVKALSTIDMMMNHAYVDNKYEFGLHLGIRKAQEDGSPGVPRPIYYFMKYMGTDMEEQYVEKARKYIGEALYDSILHPVIIAEDDPKAMNMEFFNEKQDEKR